MNLKYPVSSQPIPDHAKMVFKGEIFEIWQWKQVMFDGSIQIFEKAKRNPSVGVLPITTDKKIIITSQEQPSIKPFIGLLGGVVDRGEEVVCAAERELLEEAGLKAEKMDLWYSAQPITKIEWPIYIFVARNCEKVAEQNLDVGEKIKLKYVDWNEFLQVIRQDNFRDKQVAFKLLKAMNNSKELSAIKNFIFL